MRREVLLWNVVVAIYGALQAIEYALLILFFVIKVVKILQKSTRNYFCETGEFPIAKNSNIHFLLDALYYVVYSTMHKDVF